VRPTADAICNLAIGSRLTPGSSALSSPFQPDLILMRLSMIPTSWALTLQNFSLK
jgi:hypothetical protein